MTEIVHEILVGAAGEATGGLLTGILVAAGREIRERFKAEPRRAALEKALERSLIAAFESLPDDTSNLTKYYLDQFSSFLSKTVVHQELASLLRPYGGFDIDLLRLEFIQLTPIDEALGESIPDLDFYRFMQTLANSFYNEVKLAPELQTVIVIERLDQITLLLDKQLSDIEHNTSAIVTETTKQTGLFQKLSGEFTNSSGVLDELPYKSASSILDDFIKRKLGEKEDPWGIRTGFRDLDLMLGGLFPSHIAIGGRTNMGRKSFVLSIALAAAINSNKSVVLTKLGASTKPMLDQLLSLITGKHPHDLLSYRGDKNLDDTEKAELALLHQVRRRLTEATLFISDSSLITAPQFRHLCERVKDNSGLDLAIIDSANLVWSSEKGIKREDSLYENVRILKKMVDELEIPILTIVDVDPAVDLREEKRPNLTDISHYQAFEQFIDTVLLLYRIDRYSFDPSSLSNILEVIIPKHLDGPTGVVDLYWDRRTSAPRNLIKQNVGGKSKAFDAGWIF